MSSCLYSTIFINRGTRRTLCVHEKNDDDDDVGECRIPQNFFLKISLLLIGIFFSRKNSG